MKLEKNKVYKVEHQTVRGYPRNYIICAFKEDVVISDDFFEEYSLAHGREIFSRPYDTVFTACFDGSVMVKGDAFNPTGSSQTGISNFCTFLPIEEKDHEDIRKAIGMLGNGYRYNRKRNKIIYDIKSETHI